MNRFIELFGWYGTIAIVGAYALMSFSIIASNGWFYQTLNLTGALGIIAISWKKKAYQPAALNVIWIVIAAAALLKLLFLAN